jgi:hypothetical protein
MNTDDRWSMEVFVAEIDGETDAEVRMTKIDNRNFSGRGKAKLNPADRNVSVIEKRSPSLAPCPTCRTSCSTPPPSAWRA